MAVHFTPQELNNRAQRVIEELRAQDLSAILIFNQESMYYLTGYDSFGFCFFQCLLLDCQGNFTLLTRAPDLRQAQHTSIIKDIRIWVDQDGASPADSLIQIIQEQSLHGSKVGIELNSHGLNAYYGLQLTEKLSRHCTYVDCSNLIHALRAVKSEAEIEYVLKSGQLANDALAAAMTEAGKPNAYEGDILAALQKAIFEGGGEYPGNENIIGSADDALLCRSKSGRRKLSDTDQLTLEFAASYRRYHAALMQTFAIGTASSEQQRMHEVCLEALQNCRSQVKAGNRMGDVFQAYASTCDQSGFKQHRLNATGYSLGAVFAPSWMDYPMFYKDNPYIIQTNMVLFVHIILMNSDTKTAMTLGETYLVTENGNKNVSNASLQLLIN